MNTDATEPTAGSNPCSTAFDAGHERVGGSQVLLGVEEQGDVDGNTGRDGLGDGRQSLGGAGDLDEQVRPVSPAVQVDRSGDRRGRVVGELGGHLERHPSVHTVGPFVHRGEQVGGPLQVLDGEGEEHLLVRAGPWCRSDHVVVGPGGDRLVEDRRVGRQPGDRQFVDEPGDRPVVEHGAGDVVEPDALAQIVQLLGGRAHGLLLLATAAGRRVSGGSVDPIGVGDGVGDGDGDGITPALVMRWAGRVR
jgi:hypothetical protein